MDKENISFQNMENLSKCAIKVKKRKNADNTETEENQKAKRIRSQLSNENHAEILIKVLDIYGKRYFGSVKKEREFFLNEIQRELNQTSDSNFTKEDIVSRLKSLKKVYYLQKQKEKRGERIVWKFYDVMKKIFNEKSFNPSPASELISVEVDSSAYISEVDDREDQEEHEYEENALDLSHKLKNIKVKDFQDLTFFPECQHPAHAIRTSHAKNPSYYLNSIQQDDQQFLQGFPRSSQVERVEEEGGSMNCYFSVQY